MPIACSPINVTVLLVTEPPYVLVAPLVIPYPDNVVALAAFSL
jgi:hypothetical protein